LFFRAAPRTIFTCGTLCNQHIWRKLNRTVRPNNGCYGTLPKQGLGRIATRLVPNTPAEGATTEVCLLGCSPHANYKFEARRAKGKRKRHGREYGTALTAAPNLSDIISRLCRGTQHPMEMMGHARSRRTPSNQVALARQCEWMRARCEPELGRCGRGSDGVWVWPRCGAESRVGAIAVRAWHRCGAGVVWVKSGLGQAGGECKQMCAWCIQWRFTGRERERGARGLDVLRARRRRGVGKPGCGTGSVGTAIAGGGRGASVGRTRGRKGQGAKQA
jgi:hypothetical protein